MPRAARIKDSTAIYHTMSRSISEFDLFPDKADKEYFLDLLQKYKEKYSCKIYGYCLMSNHYHLHIDTCGFDISKFMQCLNLAYVRYINLKYDRRGPLFADRFNSKIIDSEQYNLTVSSYIHNNPKDIEDYRDRVFEYPYSSMGVYMGKRKDLRKLVDTDFMLGCVNKTDRKKAVKDYAQMVAEKGEVGINKKLKKYLEEFHQEHYEYKPDRHILIRNRKPENIILHIAKKFKIDSVDQIMHRWKRDTLKFRQVVAYALNNMCGLGYKDVCKYMNNITASCCAGLSNKGFEVLKRDDELKEFLLELSRV